MDITPIIEGLNDAQRAAVTAPPGSTLVLAGAGSGKTRVLVHRIAWLLQVEHYSPWGILAVTFTNKAAREMQQRIETLLQQPTGGLWVGTFHGLAHRLLRAHWAEAQLPQGFQILDADDQLRLIKRLLREANLDDTRWPPRQVQRFINRNKDEGLRPQHLDAGRDPYQQQMISLYDSYEAACQRAGVVDFAELLLRAHELWRDHADILQHYRQRFGAVLVDEFQDTNAVQYAWLRLLAGTDDKLFVVGDDDQSIYGWRGAKVENIQAFQTHYPHTQVVRLEQNYRSTGNILAAANAVIAQNPDRLGKSLWTAAGDGELIQLYAAYNETDEARFVVDQIRSLFAEGETYQQMAILYRTAAQSRQFEESLIQSGIPYRIYGGLRFFERSEIKDALAYLRLLENRQDDPAFERAVNQPPRGIGAKTLATVREQARAHNLSLWQAAETIIRDQQLTARAAGALARFLQLIEQTHQESKDLILSEQITRVIEVSSLRTHFAQSRDGKGQDRLENLDELINAGQQSEANLTLEGQTPLQTFLAQAALEAGDTQASAEEDCVQLMTLHAAKGLEFAVVFIGGLEEGLFPHSMSSDDADKLAEERRLCYVGMTRARRKLYLAHAETRRIHGSETFPFASRFLRDIPPETIQSVRIRTNRSQTDHAFEVSAQSNETGLSLGQQVIHPKFGSGVILNTEGHGASTRVQVKFAAAGTKWLIVAMANLTIA
jgi:DNA helicase-2/ATP-dependent DNA helicase PcrA